MTRSRNKAKPSIQPPHGALEGRLDSGPGDERMVDTTAVLVPHSKRIERLRRRHFQREAAQRTRSEVKSFVELPPELVLNVLGCLEPSDIFALLQLNRSTRTFILASEKAIAETILRRRYWVLRQCFPLPVSLDQVPDYARPALTSSQWQERLRIHKNPYQHIKHIDPATTCTCMTCVLAWNNLNTVLDLAYWQNHLDNREPIPIIPRGRNPEWNVQLLDRHAAIVHHATASHLAYARVLQIHLDTTFRTIMRSRRWRKKVEKPSVSAAGPYHLNDADIASGTDVCLERSGPPNYQPIYMRDNYYGLEAFVPNRKWDREQRRWQYYSRWPTPHENDLSWVVGRFFLDGTPGPLGRTS